MIRLPREAIAKPGTWIVRSPSISPFESLRTGSGRTANSNHVLILSLTAGLPSLKEGRGKVVASQPGSPPCNLGSQLSVRPEGNRRGTESLSCAKAGYRAIGNDEIA